MSRFSWRLLTSRLAKKKGRVTVRHIPLSVGSITLARDGQITIQMLWIQLTCRLWDVVQDLYSTDATQEKFPRSCKFYCSHPATWARSYRSYQIRKISALKDLDHHVAIDDLSKVWTLNELSVCSQLFASLSCGERENPMVLLTPCPWQS